MSLDALAARLTQIRRQHGTGSPASWIASQPRSTQRLWLAALSETEVQQLEYAWAFWAREEQLAPQGDWRFWLFRGGRGGGKTRAGAEEIRAGVEEGRYRRIALVAPTIDAGRQVMVEGPSGLLAVCPDWNRPRYEPSRHRLTWPDGATATLYSADAPERLRGPQHDAFWADELCAWRTPLYAWDMLLLGLRIGARPRGIITTTPKPITLYKQLIKDPTVVITTSSTFRNAANLAPEFIAQIVTRYEGSALGRQELHAELVEDAEGALWRRAWINASRVTIVPRLERIIVAIDPAISSHAESHETGIIVAGVDTRDHVYILSDESLRASPDTWARRAIEAYHQFGAEVLVAEANQGGDMVSFTLHTVDPNVDIQLVRASQGKRTRAEPVAALYEQGRVHHVHTFSELEDQLCLWDATSGDLSPDRLDALVWAVSELAVDAQPPLSLVTTHSAVTVEPGTGWLRDILLSRSGPRE